MSKTAVISGISELAPRKNARGLKTLDLLASAADLAIMDAGLRKEDIDGLLVAPASEDTAFMWPSQVAEYLKLSPVFMNVVELGGASAAGSVFRAALLVSSGICRHCLCLSGGAWEPDVFNSREGKTAVMSAPEISYELPYGPMGFNSAYALVARRHMHEYGTTPEQLAKIAVDQRQNALRNPLALFGKDPLSIEDVLSSPLIVDPIHLFEIVRPCSGAAAVIVSSADHSSDLPATPIGVLGMGEAYTHNSITYAPSLTSSAVKPAAERAFKMAGLRPSDIDLVSLYDCYTITVLITLEDAGFCPKGEGGAFVQSHDLTYRGSLPCNTHGGQLSCGQASYAGGASHIIEAVRQLRGDAGQRQVKRNQLAFVNGNGGTLSTQCSLVLGRF